MDTENRSRAASGSDTPRESQEKYWNGPCGNCRRVPSMWAQSSGTGPRVSCGYCCPFCPTRGRYPGKIRVIEPQDVNGDRRPVPGAASSGAPWESLANFRDGTMCGLKKVTVNTGPVRSIFGEHSFYRETWDSRQGVRHVAS